MSSLNDDWIFMVNYPFKMQLFTMNKDHSPSLWFCFTEIYVWPVETAHIFSSHTVTSILRERARALLSQVPQMPCCIP